jgi:hypothetical protein
MGVLESVKEKIEKVTGWKRPSRSDLRDAVRSRKPNSFRFKDDGVVPNNPKLPTYDGRLLRCHALDLLPSSTL